MKLDANQLSAAGRKAVTGRQWATVHACASELLKLDRANAEGHFLAGFAAMAARNGDAAMACFERVLDLDDGRYDAAIELANLKCAARRNGEAFALVVQYENRLANSPKYLNMAGSVYSGIGMPERAWPLYKRADELQPGVDTVEANLATCAVFLGRTEEAVERYRELIRKHPTHQRNHFQLAWLEKATDTRHIVEMQSILQQADLPPDRNVFMYYAIGKEYEDLERWDEAFRFYRKAGDAVASVAEYDIETDIRLIDTMIETCSAGWLASNPATRDEAYADRRPIFVVGLPRTGTTLVERIIASHSSVQSVGETQFMQMTVRRESGVFSDEKITPAMIEAAAEIDIRRIGAGYCEMLDYRLSDAHAFVDKLPFNILYLGFIAKAFPDARLVVVNRHPMDACFAMYKQVFTWAYKFSYTLEGLGRFYPAWRRLLDHWRSVLGDRLIEVGYESLIASQENETRRLLEALDLPFEEACLAFDRNDQATATASAVQVREKIHSRSVGRWRQYAEQLEPLRAALESAGIDVE